MFKFISLFALVAVASAAPGFIADSHHSTSIIQPAVLTKTAYIDNSASSAITHQSYTNLVKKVPVVQTYAAAAPVVHTTYSAAPVIKTYAAAPVVHTTYSAAPVVKTIAAPVVHTYASAPVVKTITPLVSAPIYESYASAPVVHAAPLVKTVSHVPVSYTNYHH